MTNLTHVTYCGLYCKLCGACGRIPRRAQSLKDAMTTEGWHEWGKEIPGFQDFWKFLDGLIGGCPGCRQDGGPPFCGIRKCARKREIELCVECEDYPCHRIEGLAKGYPTLIADGKRIREIGIDPWIAEQDARAETGFTYADIRCYPYEVPSD